MLLRVSGEIAPGVFLVMLGKSCHYILQAERGVAVIDPGTPAHARALRARLAQTKLPSSVIRVLLTHSHPERAGGVRFVGQPNGTTFHIPRGELELFRSADSIAALEREAAEIVPDESSSEPLLHQRLVDVAGVGEGSVISWGSGIEIVVFPLPLHTEHSCAYLINPLRVLIVDEGLGYYNGRGPSAVGADWRPDLIESSIKRIIDLDVQVLGLPYGGALTGSLVRKHLDEMLAGYQDLSREVAAAKGEGVDPAEMRAQIFEYFYSTLDGDRSLLVSRDRSFEALCGHLGI